MPQYAVNTYVTYLLRHEYEADSPEEAVRMHNQNPNLSDQREFVGEDCPTLYSVHEDGDREIPVPEDQWQ